MSQFYVYISFAGGSDSGSGSGSGSYVKFSSNNRGAVGTGVELECIRKQSTVDKKLARPVDLLCEFRSRQRSEPSSKLTQQRGFDVGRDREFECWFARARVTKSIHSFFGFNFCHLGAVDAGYCGWTGKAA